SNEADREHFAEVGHFARHGAANLGIAATSTAYDEGEEWLGDILAYLRRNRDTVASMVRELLPRARLTAMEGTYVAWLDLREYGITGSLHDHLLEQARVECTEGTACGAGWAGHVRLIYAMPHPLLVEAITRIARWPQPRRAACPSPGPAPAVIVGGMPTPPQPRPDQPDAQPRVPDTGAVLFSHAPAPEPDPSDGAADAEQTGWPWFLPQDG